MDRVIEKEYLEKKIKELEEDNEYLHMKCEKLESDSIKCQDASLNMAKAQLIRHLRDVIMNLTVEE
jgi:hypothetical protein